MPERKGEGDNCDPTFFRDIASGPVVRVGGHGDREGRVYTAIIIACCDCPNVRRDGGGQRFCSVAQRFMGWMETMRTTPPWCPLPKAEGEGK